MGTKQNPGPHDCYAAAAPDEPMFVLLARDPLAPILVDLWATLRARELGGSNKADAAFNTANDMREWVLRQRAQEHVRWCDIKHAHSAPHCCSATCWCRED